MEQLKDFPPEKMAKLNSLQSSIFKDWHKFHTTIPATLYHYTAAEGLIGILTTKSFWMTNLRYMNDLSEIQYATELIRSVLKSRSSDNSSNVLLSEFFRRVENTFNPFEGGVEAFAASFCENGNLLSQWRAYGGKGGGYALGLDFFHMVKFMSKECFLRKVIYDPTEQKQIIMDMIDKICQLLNELNPNQDIQQADSDNTLPQFCLFLNRILGEYIFSFKHPEFAQEEEWRLVHLRDCNLILNRESDFEDLKFRTFGGNVIPFCEVSFENALKASLQDEYGIAFPIQELVIGPTLNPDLNRQSVQTLLTKINPDHFPIIKKSGIPLRWL